MKRTKLLTALATFSVAAVVVLPEVAGFLLAFLAKASFALGTLFVAGSAWFQRNSNDPSEKAGWAVLFIAGVILVVWSLASGFLNLPRLARDAALVILAIGALFFLFKADDEAKHA